MEARADKRPSDSNGATTDSVSASREYFELPEEHGTLEISDLILIGIAAIVALLRLVAIPGYYWIALSAVLVWLPIYREALESVRERRMTMELSLTIALVAAITIGEVFAALMIVLFVLVAEVIAAPQLSLRRNRSPVETVCSHE